MAKFEEIWPEKEFEEEKMETDFVFTECSQQDYALKLISEEVRRRNLEKEMQEGSQKEIDIESLSEKYGTFQDYQEKNRETAALQKQLIEACAADDNEKIQELKKFYQERHPNQIDGVLTLFSFNEFLNNQKDKDILSPQKNKLIGEANKLKAQKNDLTKNAELDELIKSKYAQAAEIDAKILENIEKLAAFQNRASNFIVKSAEQEKLLEGFWKLLRDIAAAKDNTTRLDFRGELKEGSYSKTMEMAMASIVNKATAVLALESNGYDTANSTPEEDILLGADIWISGKNIKSKIPAQIMSRPRGRRINCKKNNNLGQ